MNQKNTTYDYCNINESRTIYLMLKDIVDYFDLSKDNSNNQCKMIDNSFSYYMNKFILLDSGNMPASVIVKCPHCQKKFRSRPFLYLHNRISHLSEDETFQRDYFCPGDLCKGMNCERYKAFYSIPYMDNNSKDILFYNRQPISRVQVCNPDLIPFYKAICMKMIEGCFSEEDEDKYYTYYKYICQKISCDKPIDNQLSQGGDFFGVLRLIFMYITGISTFIYLLIVWLTKYA